MPRVDDSCRDIVTRHGVAWWMESTAGKHGTTIKEALGIRSGDQQSNKCFVSNGSAYIEVPNTHFFNRLFAGSFTLGMFINMPPEAANGIRHTLFSKKDDFTLYEQTGNFYLEIGGQVVIDTEPSGHNYADDKTHLLIAWRDATKNTVKVGIELFTEYRREEVIDPNPNLSSTSNLFIAAEENGAGPVNNIAFSGTKIFGAFFLTGNVLELHERQEYWQIGRIPVNDVVFLQLDETVGEIAFDSSGLKHHGVVRNYDPEVWGVLNEGFSWQNRYGYSSGQYTIDKGVSSVEIGGVNYPIDPTVLVPFQNGLPTLDVVDLPLENLGRVKLDIRIEDILCYKGNGVTYGTVNNPSRLEFTPGTDEFAVFSLFEHIAAESGILIRVGAAANPLYEIGFNAGTDEILVKMGSTVHSIQMDEGFRRGIFNFTATQLDVIVDAQVLGSYTLDATGEAGAAYVFGSDVGGAIQSANMVMLGVKSGVMNSDDQDRFFAEGLLLPIESKTIYVPCSKTSILFDVSGAANHAILQEFTGDVWEGRQSEYAYLFGGYTKVYMSRQNLDVSSVIPFTVYGDAQAYDIYGEDQFNLRHDWTGGLNMFDCFVNMNPYNVDLGFLTRFWNKDSSDIWSFLNGAYIRSNPWLWHVSELTQTALETALAQGFWNYAFSGSRVVQPEGIVVEIVDLLLLNLGNNIQEKYLPA